MTKNCKKASRYSAMDKRHFPFVYIILILPVVHIAVFWFYVNAQTLLNAFVDASGNPSFESIIRVAKNFTGSLDDWGYNPLEMLGKSVLIWVNLHIVCLVIGTFMSFILTKHMIGAKAFRVIYMVPSLVGAVVFSGIIKNLYAYNGPIIKILNDLKMDIPIGVLWEGLLGDKTTAFPVMYLQMFVLSITGGNMLMASAFMKIPEEIFESAQIEGCGFFREAFQIAIPCAWPMISTMITFSLCSFFTADYSFYLYSNGTGQCGLTSIGYYLYQFQVRVSGTTDTKYLIGYTSALGMFITIVTIPIVLVGRKIVDRFNDGIEF